jgi:RimJ/RimL family protein N-acetyltransferase
MPMLVAPARPLRDEVVVLRGWRAADVDQVTAACQDPSIHRYIAVPWPYERSDAVAYLDRVERQWRDGTKAAFAIAAASDPDRVLGAIAVAVGGSVGNAAYWVAPEARGRGVAGRALRLVTSWALRDLELGAVILEIDPSNLASRHVAESAGYHAAGHLGPGADEGQPGLLIYSHLAVEVPAGVSRANAILHASPPGTVSPNGSSSP